MNFNPRQILRHPQQPVSFLHYCCCCSKKKQKKEAMQKICKFFQVSFSSQPLLHKMHFMYWRVKIHLESLVISNTEQCNHREYCGLNSKFSDGVHSAEVLSLLRYTLLQVFIHLFIMLQFPKKKRVILCRKHCSNG